MDRLTRLYYQDGLTPTVIGYFNSGACERAARGVYEAMGKKVHSTTVSIAGGPALEHVDAGDADRVQYILSPVGSTGEHVGSPVNVWLSYGADSVEVRRYEVNGFRTPYGSGGATEPAHVLFVLRVKAPKE